MENTPIYRYLKSYGKRYTKNVFGKKPAIVFSATIHQVYSTTTIDGVVKSVSFVDAHGHSNAIDASRVPLRVGQDGVLYIDISRKLVLYHTASEFARLYNKEGEAYHPAKITRTLSAIAMI